jgi:hypothetical protein
MKNDQIVARIQEGQEQRGELTPMEFFAQHADSSVEMLWMNECMCVPLIHD